MHTLWEADVLVFKAHITTGPGGRILDMFWIYDNRSELPETHRCSPTPARNFPLDIHDTSALRAVAFPLLLTGQALASITVRCSWVLAQWAMCLLQNC